MRNVKKKALSIALASTMLLGSTVFAAELDLRDKTTNTQHKFSDALRSPSLFRKVSSTKTNYLIEGKEGKLYELSQIQAKIDEGLSFTEATQVVPEVGTTSELKVESVSAITTTFVEVEFAALAEAKTDATVTVKDNTGKVVAVQATNIPAGATAAQFDLVTPLVQADLTGVWTINGVEYNFNVIEQFDDIMQAVSDGNQVALLNALNAANIQNVDSALIGDYLTDISGATTTPENLADIQAIVNKTNEDAVTNDEKAAAVKAVEDAKTQVALLNALKTNFKRVNSDWIVEYADGTAGSSSDSVAGILVNTAPTANTGIVADGATDSGVALTYTNIQTIIDAVNEREIDLLDTAANTAAKQAAVTTLIEKWEEDDNPATPNVTPKADHIEESNINRLGFVVAEATTQNSLYNALVAYANATNDTTLKASELNPNLKAEYLAEMNASSNTKRNAAVAGFTGLSSSATYDYKANIVQAADTVALNAALSTINGLTSTNTAAQVKAALQKLADVTSHKTGAAKFDMSTVKDDQLLNYVTLATNGFAAATINSIALVNTAITSVNGSIEEQAALDTITSSSSSVAQVKNALTELALANSNTSTDAYVNASSQVKTEVAELIMENRASLADPLTVASVTDHAASGETYAANAIQKALVDQAAEVAKFNAIGDLASATTTSIKTALDNYKYDAYEALSAVDKVKVAQEIGKLTKPVGSPAVDTPLDFSGSDAVTTMAQANAIIDTAIAGL